MRFRAFVVSVIFLTAVAHAELDLGRLTQSISEVGPEGRGNAEAGRAWKELSTAPATTIPAILTAMNGANDYALNWFRTAIESIAQRAQRQDQKLPIAAIQQYIQNHKNDPKARRLAYELIAMVEPNIAKSMVRAFINDPGNELRRDAVQLLADEASAKLKAGEKQSAITQFQEALSAARDPDQIESIAKSLEDLGEKVDLQKTFGWITRWKVIGPFSNASRSGFNQAYPPETTIDYSAEYDGLSGKVKWLDYTSQNPMGLIDFNQPLTSLKEVTAYAAGEFWSNESRGAELRLGCKNGWKVWVNGKLLFGRDEYHRGMEVDQYRFPITLVAGKNVILVKCCQNEQKEDWTKEWEFQLRITDAAGTPIASNK